MVRNKLLPGARSCEIPVAGGVDRQPVLIDYTIS